LQSVGGDLDLSYTSVESFGDLKYVGNSLFVTSTPLSKKYSMKEIEEMVNVGQRIFM